MAKKKKDGNERKTKFGNGIVLDEKILLRIDDNIAIYLDFIEKQYESVGAKQMYIRNLILTDMETNGSYHKYRDELENVTLESLEQEGIL